jgi:hypothetical protein
MLVPEHLLIPCQRLPVHRLRLFVIALAVQHKRQVLHARQRGWMPSLVVKQISLLIALTLSLYRSKF